MKYLNVLTILVFIFIVILIILHAYLDNSPHTHKKSKAQVLSPAYWDVDGVIDYNPPHKKYHEKYSPHPHHPHHHPPPHHHPDHHGKGAESEGRYIDQLH